NVADGTHSCRVPNQPSPNGTLADSTDSTFSHELIELITDPDLNAWYYDPLGGSGEIGDLCRNVTQTFAVNGHQYELQTEYDNKSHGCTTGPTVTAQNAAMTAPAPGSRLTSTTVTFSWDAGVGVGQYWLEVGTAAGTSDIYGASSALNRSATVSGLPANGQTLYVRLWSLIAGAWGHNDYVYTAMSGQAAAVTAPTPGSTLAGGSVTFQWTAGVGVTEYWLEVGSAAGRSDIYGASAGTNRSVTLTGLPTDGRPLYVRLWSSFSGAWQSNS